MNHAVESPITPYHSSLCPSAMLAELPVELSPLPLSSSNVKPLQLEECLADWNLDQFPLPFPTPDIPDDQSNDTPAFGGNPGSGIFKSLKAY